MNQPKNPLLQTMLALTGDRQVITIHHAMVDFCEGDLHPAMMLEQLLYWSPRATDPDGWVIKSDDEWIAELHITRYAVRAAAYYLVERKIMESTKKDWYTNNVKTQRNAYRPIFDELEKQWLDFISRPLSENEQWSPLSENEQRSPRPLSENEQSSLTKITVTENTNGLLFPKSNLKDGPDPRWDFQTMGDYTTYPERQWGHLIEFCLAFTFKVPRLNKSKKKATKGTAALWISELDSLIDACQPYGPIAIQWYYRQFCKQMLMRKRKDGQATAPHTVSKPGSIVNGVSGMLAAMQQPISPYQPIDDQEFENIMAELNGQETNEQPAMDRTADEQQEAEQIARKLVSS